MSVMLSKRFCTKLLPKNFQHLFSHKNANGIAIERKFARSLFTTNVRNYIGLRYTFGGEKIQICGNPERIEKFSDLVPLIFFILLGTSCMFPPSARLMMRLVGINENKNTTIEIEPPKPEVAVRDINIPRPASMY